MTKIKNYPLDLQVNGGDKWIGTDSASLAKLTKNFTPDNLATYYNNSEVVQVVNQMRFFYDTVDPGDDRASGSFSFPTEVGPTVPFSSITDLVFSKYTMGNDAVNNFMTDIVNSIIIIQKSDNPDIYAFYALNAYTVDPLDANFYNVELSFESGNGSVEEDEDYLIGLIQFAGAGGVQTILGSTFIDSTLTGVGEVTISLSATGTPSNLTGLRGDNTWGTLGLESLDEGNGIGWRLIGRDAANYGNIGLNAIDFSNSDSVSTEKGSVGLSSITFGFNNINQQSSTLMIGSLNNAEITDEFQGSNFITGYDIDVYGSVYNSFIGMYRGTVGVQGTNYVTNAIYQSVVVGDGANFYAGRDAGAIGGGLISGSTGVFTVGIANEDLTTTTSNYLTSQYNNYGPRFIVGCGTYNPVSQVATRANGFVVMSDGTATFPLLTNALIDAANDDSAVTKGWVNSGPALTSEQVRIEVKNTSGGPLVKGTPVYITGTVGATIRAEVAAADASSSTTMPAVGVLLQDLINNEDGFAVTGGFLTNITTDPIDGLTPTENDTVYVKAGGGLTLTKPTGSNLIQNIAKVGKVSGGNAGSLVISSILRTNDVPNLTTGKIWVGTATNTAESGVVYLDEGNGRMGIGTTSPDQELHIEGANTPTLRIEDTTNNAVLQAAALDSSVYIGATSNHALNLRTNNTNRIAITNTGDVGIGTTSPLNLLHVAGAARLDGDLVFTGTGFVNNNAGDIEIATVSNKNILFNPNGTGKVGIGTTSPARKFEVSIDTNDEVARFSAPLSNDAYIEISNGSAVGVPKLGTVVNDFVFITDGSSEKMRIANTGNVGIGTTNPIYKLELGSGDFSLPLGSFIRFGPQIGITKASNGKLSIYGGTGATTAGGVDLYRWDGAAYSTALRLSNTGQIQLDEYGSGTFTGTATQRLAVDSSGNVIEIPIGSGPVDGSGTANYLTYWSDVDTIAASKILQTSTGYQIQGNSGANYTKLQLLSPATKTLSLFEITNGSDENNASATIYGRGDSSYPTINAISRGTGTTQAINFAIDSSEKMRINTNGNVGIGTTSPATLLNLSGNDPDLRFDDTSALTRADLNTEIGFYDSTGANGSYIGHRSSADLVMRSTSGAMRLGTFADSQLVNLVGNNVGIGTTSPSEKLHISSGYALVENTGTGSSIIINRTDGKALNLKAGSGAGQFTFDNTGFFAISSDTKTNVLSGAGSGNQVFVVTGSGNVGIGTTSPSEKLDVEGRVDIASDIRLRGQSTSLNIGVVRLYVDATNNFFIDPGNAGTALSTFKSTGAVQLGNYGSGTFTGTATQRLAVDSSGNVIEIPIGSGPVDGSGTANYVTKWSDADTITDSLLYDDGAQILIGATSSVFSDDLYINNSAYAQAGWRVGTTTTYVGKLFNNSGVLSLQADGTRSVGFGNFTNGEIVRIDGINSRVGIGLTAPSTTLHIADSSAVITLQDDNSTGNTSTTRIDFQDNGTFGTIGQIGFIGTDDLEIKNTHTGNILLDGGNVGIGTTSPSEKLHVAGNQRLDGDEIYITQAASPRKPVRLHQSAYKGAITLQRDGVDNVHISSDFIEQGHTYFNGTNVNVGIGTTSPTDLLHIEGASTPTLKIVDTTNTTITELYSNDFDTYLANESSGRVFIRTGGSNGFVVDSAGDVGIGTTNPIYKLDIQAESPAIRIQDISDANSFLVGADNSGGYLGMFTNDSLRVYTNSLERMRITSAGNVGIGMTSPRAKLEIKGTGGNASGLILSNTNEIFRQYWTGDAVGSTFAMTYDGTGGNDFQIQSDGDIIFADNTGGKVGIGTTNPAAKLDVNGGVRIADDAAVASATNVGTLRYRSSGNNSYVDMCMQTGAATYAWVNIVQNNW